MALFKIVVLLFTLTLFCKQIPLPNLHIGTGGFGYGCGSNSPAAQLPFSFVRLGPDTSPVNKQLYEQFQHYGGYHDSDEAVRAFSHMHLVGAGVMDMGVLGILPLVPKNQDSLPHIALNKIVRMQKAKEVAEPGYYSTYLPKEKIKVQLTSTQRCGVHKYFYLNYQNKPIDIHIMTSYLLSKQSPRSSSTSICGKKCVQGSVKVMGGFGGRFGGYTVYYHLQIINRFEESSQLYLYKDASIVNETKVSGNRTGAVYRTKSNEVEIQVGLSYVSIKNARMNFNEEIRGRTFNQIREESKQIWFKQLSRFQISAINKEVQVKIDTAIYRTLLTPTIFQDFNGQYVSFQNDGTTKIKPSSMQHVYTDMSLWDVHRSQMPWLLFQDPQRFADISMSIVLINRQGGYMPKWPFAQGATGCMIGAHANTVLADWIVKESFKEPEKYNLTEILSFMLRNANTQTRYDSRSVVDLYPKLGYIPFDKEKRSSCSETLEYSYNDFSISQVARILNQTQHQTQFLRRSKFYKNVWNQKTKFFEPRHENGTFKNITQLGRINIFSNYYVEGDAWHYRFFAPHDAKGLIQLFGGEKPFVNELNKLFSKSVTWPTFWLPNPYYWAGNQHDLFSVWLFQYANRSDLTEKYSRQIIDLSYGTSGSGLPGNDDYGTMSAWLVFACLGFYPLPSTQTYVLGSPYVNYARIERRIGQNKTKTFTIKVNQNEKDKVHVKRIEMNKKEVSKTVRHEDFAQSGSLLEFWMKL